MSKVRVACFSVSIDGYGAGPRQDLENPLGVGGLALHDWAFATRSFAQQHGAPDAANRETGVDDDFMTRSFDGVGAWVMGRNMFGPVRGPWSAAEEWNGWWGDDPPFHTHVFVLTHHPRPSLVMDGGSTFHFVTEGIETALARAQECAQGRDVRIGGGVSTVRQYLQAGLVDEIHLALAPVLLGSGEALLRDIDLPALGFRCVEHVGTARATHVVLRKGD